MCLSASKEQYGLHISTFCDVCELFFLLIHILLIIENHCTKQRSHLGLVAVNEGTKYNILVYCDALYEQILYNY